jgi:hypothetical protein
MTRTIVERSRQLHRSVMFLCCQLVVFEAAVALAAAQPASGGRPVYSATRIDVPPQLDGDLSDPAWSGLPVIRDFVQQLPNEGMPSTERTEVKIAFDSSNLYIAARCYDSEPEKIIANELRRDVLSISTKDDNFAVILDPFRDYRNGVAFIITAKGSMHDVLITDERQFNWDWDAVWDARTRIDDQGWTVEIAIPFKSLRYDTERGGPWGMNLRRVIMRKNEHTFLTAIPSELGVPGAGKLSLAAELEGLDDLAESHYLEVKPYSSSGFSEDHAREPSAGRDAFFDAGIDLKYGVTQGLNLDATYNTDFAQVEADTQQINLTRFNLFFPEKREFFLEGRDVYTFGVPQGFAGRQNTTLLFFSRRIGIESGREVPILGGARLTGKAGSYSVGLLNITTDEQTGTPRSNYTVARVKRELFERSNVGMIYTNKSPAGGDTNQSVGVDANFLFHRSSGARFFLAKTKTAGVTDGDVSGRAQFNFDLDLWGVEADYVNVGRNFNPEVGFVRRRDIRSSFGGARFSPRLNKTWVRQIFFTADMEYVTDTENKLQTRINNFAFEVETPRADKVSFTLTRNLENLDFPFPIQSTVIIPVGLYHFDEQAVRFELGPSRKISGSVNYSFGGFFSGDKKTLTLNAISKPSTQFSLETAYERNDVDLPEGDFVTHLVGTRFNYSFNTRMFTSAFLQWNSDAELASLNLRFNYIYKLGSDLFVVYNENRQTAGLARGLIDRSFIVKFTYLLRL